MPKQTWRGDAWWTDCAVAIPACSLAAVMALRAPPDFLSRINLMLPVQSCLQK
jgi:hypothetical protein